MIKKQITNALQVALLRKELIDRYYQQIGASLVRLDTLNREGNKEGFEKDANTMLGNVVNARAEAVMLAYLVKYLIEELEKDEE